MKSKSEVREGQSQELAAQSIEEFKGFLFPRSHANNHVPIGWDRGRCPLCDALQRIENLSAKPPKLKHVER